jgi:hypothetical protein
MIAVPERSQILFESLLLGGIGFVGGTISHADAPLAASVLIIGNIANHILFELGDAWVRPQLSSLRHSLKFSSEAIYVGTNSVVTVATILAAQQLELLSRRMASVLIFMSLAVLAARISILSNS